MLLGPRSAWALIAVVGTLAAASCSGNEDDAAPVPARPGLSQPEPGGTMLGEDEACGRVIEAEDRRRRSLMCDELVHAPCPFYVRPGGTGCWTYPEDAVRACEEVIAGYASCLDFNERKCIVTAVQAPDGNCPPLGGGGAGPGTG